MFRARPGGDDTPEIPVDPPDPIRDSYTDLKIGGFWFSINNYSGYGFVAGPAGKTIELYTNDPSTALPTVSYVRGLSLVAAVDANGTRTYYHYNAHGDVVQLTNSSGAVTKDYTYDAFGIEKSASGADANPFRYCGEQFDTETGNYYLRARYYSPGIGRFTQEDTHWNPGNMVYGDEPQKWNEWQGEEDPLGLHAYTHKPEATAVAQAGNLYAYAGSNPIVYHDPTGEAFMFVTAIVGIAVGALAGGITSYIKTGQISWTAVGAGAAIGGAIGLTGGAAIAYAATGTITASTTAVLSAGASWAATMAAPGATTSAAIGRTFEKWFYAFNNVSTKAQQVVVKGVGRIDAFLNGKIYELKNYNWGNYSASKLNQIGNDFVAQAQRYMNVEAINGNKVNGIVFYFSSKPPESIIKSLKAVGVAVQWVPNS